MSQNIRFEKSASGDALVIRYRSKVVYIKLETIENNTNNNIGDATLSIFDYSDEKEPPKLISTHNLVVKRKNKVIYIKMLQRLAPIKYLTAMDMKDTRESIRKYWIKYCETFPNTSRYPNSCDVSNDERTDRENWKFGPNIRGLLVQILIKSEEDRSGRVHDVRINNMLKNLSENYPDFFPFLMYYNKYFESEFDSLADDKLMPQKFYISLIKEIAQEMRNILDKVSDEELTYRVTERFYNKIEHYFDTGLINDKGLLFPGPLISASDIDIHVYEKVMAYLTEMSIYLRDEQKKRSLKLNYDTNTYVEKKTFYKLRNDIEDKINSAVTTDTSPRIVSFYEIVDKHPLIERVSVASVNYYDNPIRAKVISDLIYFVESAFKNKDAKYLAAGLCLILKSAIEELKSGINTGMTFKNACMVLTERGIPADCHRNLISKLGFNITLETKSYKISIPKLISSEEEESKGGSEITGVLNEEILVQRLTTTLRQS